MKFGVTCMGLEAVELAGEADAAGWDGIFLWDGIWGTDPWVVLAAVAARTERLMLGPMLTPVSRRRPWKVASEAVTLDHVSGGRCVLPVGLGAPETGFDKVGEQTDRKVRAQMLDEGLDIITGLWSGQPFSYSGQHYHVDDVTFGPTPVQSPRIPIWVVGAWPRQPSMRRVARYDGWLTGKMSPEGFSGVVSADEIRAAKAFIDEHRSATTPFDIIMEGETPGEDPGQVAAILQPLAAAGVTWWLENIWDTPFKTGGVEGMRARIRQGPPQI